MKTSTVAITGMTCPNCAKAVEQKLLGTPGIYEAQVDLSTHSARVVYDENVCSMKCLLAAVSDAGYRVGGFSNALV